MNRIFTNNAPPALNLPFLNSPVNLLLNLLKPELRKILILGFLMAVLVQLSGINIIIDYAPRIFQASGWGLDIGLFATFGLGIVNFVISVMGLTKLLFI